VEPEVRVRAMTEDDLDPADLVVRLAFGTFRGLPDPAEAFGDADRVRTRFRAAPDCAWVAEADGEVVGAVFATRWGSFGYFGPLAVHPDHWDREIGKRLMEPVLEAFDRGGVRQAGLFTFASSPKHLGLYQAYGFWPGSLVSILAKPVPAEAEATYELASAEHPLEELRRLTDAVFEGLDLGQEVAAVTEQGIGDTIMLRRDGELVGIAVCHCGAGSEAGSGTCYVKFGAVAPGETAAGDFERLLDACEAFAARSGLERLVAGVSVGRLDAYRRLLERGFRADLIGVSMWLLPGEPKFDTPADYVLDDLR
jgi:N-acetylglutamate synthase-like GNAT family acetyltransferase